MRTFTLYNPTRNIVSVMTKESKGVYKQVNILPRSSIVITESQISDNIRNLSSEPRNILKLKLNTNQG